MVTPTLTIRNVKREKPEEALIAELRGYTKESWAGNQETQRLKYDGITLTYYGKGGTLHPRNGR